MRNQRGETVCQAEWTHPHGAALSAVTRRIPAGTSLSQPRQTAMGEWFEDEALWRDFYPFLFAEERSPPGRGRGRASASRWRESRQLREGGPRPLLRPRPAARAARPARAPGHWRGPYRAAPRPARASERVSPRWTSSGSQADMREFRRPELPTTWRCRSSRHSVLLPRRRTTCWSCGNVRQSLPSRAGVLVMDLDGQGESRAESSNRLDRERSPAAPLLVERCQVVEDWTADRKRVAAGTGRSGACGTVPPEDVLGVRSSGTGCARPGFATVVSSWRAGRQSLRTRRGPARRGCARAGTDRGHRRGNAARRKGGAGHGGRERDRGSDGPPVRARGRDRGRQRRRRGAGAVGGDGAPASRARVPWRSRGRCDEARRRRGHDALRRRGIRPARTCSSTTPGSIATR